MRLFSRMRTPSTLTTTAALAAVALLTGAGAAHAAAPPTHKPAPAGSANSVAPDAAADRTTRFAHAHGALGAYFDAGRKQVFVVTSMGSSLTTAAVDRAVGTKARLDRRRI